MPLVILEGRSVFLHTPKTGGTWLRKALANGGVQAIDFHTHGISRVAIHSGRRHEHAGREECRNVFPKGKRFTIVRNPFEWYQSWWWQQCILAKTYKLSYVDFVLQIIDDNPNGYLTREYQLMDGPGVIVLRNETLADDLCQLLIDTNVKFDEACLRNTPRANVGATEDKYKGTFELPNSIIDKLVQTEHEAFNKYDYQKEPLCES